MPVPGRDTENPALVLLAVKHGASVGGGEGDGEGVDGEKGVSWVGSLPTGEGQ